MMKGNQNCDLESCYLCRHCMEEWIPAVGAQRKNLHVAKGETLFKEDDPVNGMYFVYRGTFKVHKKWGNSKELILRFAKAGDIVGHRGLGSDLRYPISATALEPGMVCFVSMEFFNATLKVNPHFTLSLLSFFAEELSVSEKKMRNLAHMSVKGRIAMALITLKTKFGVTETGSLSLRISRQDFASYVGTTYETTFRMLTEMAEEKMIRLQKKEIVLMNEGKLIQCYESEGEDG